MANLETNKRIVLEFMQEQADIRGNREDIETQFVKDTINHHYQLVNIGFSRRGRVYGCFLHIDLKPNGKVWIQHDGTDLGVAALLHERGIPKNQIILAFHEPKYRHHTGFAAA